MINPINLHVYDCEIWFSSEINPGNKSIYYYIDKVKLEVKYCQSRHSSVKFGKKSWENPHISPFHLIIVLKNKNFATNFYYQTLEKGLKTYH